MSPSKVWGLFIKISAIFTANFRFVAVLYIPYLVPSIFFDARLVRSNRLVKSNKMQQNVAKTGWELTKVARIGRSRSVYGQKRVEGGVANHVSPNSVFAAFILLPTRFWPRTDRELPFLAIAQN